MMSKNWNGSRNRSTKHGGRGDTRIQRQQRRLLLLRHSATCTDDEKASQQPCKVTPCCAEMKTLWKHMEDCKNDKCKFTHCISSRSLLTHYMKCKNLTCPTCGPVLRWEINENEVQANQRSAATAVGDNASSMLRESEKFPSSDEDENKCVQFDENAPTSESPPLLQPAPGDFHTDDSSAIADRSITKQGSIQNVAVTSTATDEKKVQFDKNEDAVKPLKKRHKVIAKQQTQLRNKQQRLLLLRHASKCGYTENCPITQHCSAMKQLWKHLAVCRQKHCDYPHCMSSRYILAHFRQCKDPECNICLPVRECMYRTAAKVNAEKQGLPVHSIFRGVESSTSNNNNDGKDNDDEEEEEERPTKRQKLSNGNHQPRDVIGGRNGMIRLQPMHCPIIIPSSSGEDKDEEEKV